MEILTVEGRFFRCNWPVKGKCKISMEFSNLLLFAFEGVFGFLLHTNMVKIYSFYSVQILLCFIFLINFLFQIKVKFFSNNNLKQLRCMLLAFGRFLSPIFETIISLCKSILGEIIEFILSYQGTLQ